MEHKILNRYPMGNPKRKWKQKEFVLSNFSIAFVHAGVKEDNEAETPIATDTEKVVKHLAEVGFNMIECGWASPKQADDAAKYAEKYGIDLIYQDLKRYGGMQANRLREKNDLESVIREYRDNKRVIGYYIWDEPYVDDQLQEARVLTDICEKEAPDLMPFSVAIPSYNPKFTWRNGLFPDYLERYITTIEPPVLSLDYYPIGLDQNKQVQLDRSNMWLDLGLMRKLAREHDMPLWFYYQGINMRKVHFTFPMVRCMMYAAALYGAKGLQQFTAIGNVTTQSGEKGIFFDEQKTVNYEFQNLGNTLMALNSRAVIHDSAIEIGNSAFDELHEKISDSEFLTEELPTRVSVAELDDDYGNKYMMILNRDYVDAKEICLPLNSVYRTYEVSKKDGKQNLIADSTDKLEISLAAGDAILLRLQKAEEEAYTVEYKLV